MGDATFPLTPLQSAWLDQRRRRDRLGLSRPVRHSPSALLHVRGHLDRGLLHTALAAVVERHAALRVRLCGDDQPRQVVGPVDVRLGDLDLAGETAAAVLTRRCAVEFDPAAAVFDAAIATTGPDESAVLLRADHLVADLWSLDVLLRDLCDAYGAARGALPPPAGPVTDYPTLVTRELAWLDSDAGLAARARCADLAEAVVPVELPSGSGPAGTRVERSWTLPAAALVNRCRQARTTVGTALLSALGAAMADVLGLPAVSVLVVFTGRDSSELRDVVALRTNTLPVRVDARRGRPVHELLKPVHRANFLAMACQSVPWPVVVTDHVTGEQPPIGVALQYLPGDLGTVDDGRARAAFGGADVHAAFGTVCPTGAPLDVQVSERAEGLRIAFQFGTADVDEAFVDDVVRAMRANLLSLSGEQLPAR